MSVLLILFYVLLTLGAVCSIINFVILASLGSLMARLSERLGELVDILFIVGNRKADRSVENLPGRGRGLGDVPHDPQRYERVKQATYDERHSRPLPPDQVKNQSIGPDGRKSDDGWETNI